MTFDPTTARRVDAPADPPKLTRTRPGTFDPTTAMPASLLSPPAASEPPRSPSTIREQFGAVGKTPYGEGAGYLIDNPITRGLAESANTVGTGLSYLGQRLVRPVAPDLAKSIDTNVTQPLLERGKGLEAPETSNNAELAAQTVANLAGSISLAVPSEGASVLSRVGTAARLGAPAAGAQAARIDAENKEQAVADGTGPEEISAPRLGAMVAANTAANMIPISLGGNALKRVAAGAVSGVAGNELVNVAAGNDFGTGAAPAAVLGAALGTLPHAHGPSSLSESIPGPIERAANAAPAAPAAPITRGPVPHPDAAPGSMSDAVNVMHAGGVDAASTTPPTTPESARANPQEATTAPPAQQGAEPVASARAESAAPDVAPPFGDADVPHSAVRHGSADGVADSYPIAEGAVPSSDPSPAEFRDQYARTLNAPALGAEPTARGNTPLASEDADVGGVSSAPTMESPDEVEGGTPALPIGEEPKGSLKAQLHQRFDSLANGGPAVPPTPRLAKEWGITPARARTLRSEVVAERRQRAASPNNAVTKRIIFSESAATKHNVDETRGGGEIPPPSLSDPSAAAELASPPSADSEPRAATVEAAALASAAHPENERPEPTAAQHEAGNYASGHVRLHGLDVTIQVPKGGMRRGTDAKGKAWERAASDHYGHIRGTTAQDGEPHDVYLGPHAEDPNAKVFVIRQVKPGTNVHDEDKAMIGYPNGRAARKSYDANFPKGLKVFGGIQEMSIDQFKQRIGKAPEPTHALLPKEAATAGLSEREQAQPPRVEAAAKAWRERGPQSPFFKRYFEGSKVAKATGEAVPVFHGTGEDFSVFDNSRAGEATAHSTSPLGHFFTEDRALAQRYAEKAADGRPADERVIAAYMAVKKPYEMKLAEAHAIDDPAQARALRAKLEAQGYDGIHIAEAKSWIAFKSEQIKSVENRGTFDASHPDILYSRASVVQGDRYASGLPVENVERIAKDFLAGYKGHVPLKVRVGKTMEEIYGPGHESELGNAKGAYHARSGFLTLAADRVSSRADAAATLRHEILGHYGLNTLAPADKRALLETIVAARSEPSLRATWEKVDRLYGDKPELVRAEEVFADLAGQERGAVGQVWDRVLAMLQEGLRKIGLVRGVTSRAELQDMARRIGDGIRSGERVQRTFPADDHSQFAHSETTGQGAAVGLMPPLLARREDSKAGADHLTEDQRAALGKIGTFARGEAFPEKMKRLSDRWREKLVQGVVDQFAPLKMLDSDAYMQARLSRGTDGALEATFLHGTPKLTDGALDVTTDGKGLRGVLAGLKGEHDLFLAWIAGNRAARLNAEDRENLFNPAEIRSLQSLDRGKMPDGRDRAATYKAAFAEFNRYQRAVLDIGEQAGLFTAESRAQWSHEFYVPFFRDLAKKPVAAGAGDGTQFAESGTDKVVQELKGGTQPLGDLLSNTLENWSRILTASMRNMAASKALIAAERMGIATKVEKAEKQSVRVMRNGTPVHYDVRDPLVLDALTMLNFDGESNTTMRVLGTLKRALSFGVTVNPAFRVRNMLRDTMSAMAVSDAGANPLRNLVEGWRATGAESETFHKLLASGGAVRFGALNDGEQAAHAKRLVTMGIKDSQILDTPGKIKNTLNHAWEWWKEIGDRGETVNRAVIYDRARAKGATHLEAAYQARDLLDFTMGGKWAATQFLAHTVPFLNARVQGLYKLGRGAHENPIRFTAVTGAIALASAATYLLQKDDPEYRDLPDWARDTYWCVKLGDKMLFLPKPFEIGALGSVIERGTELATAGDDYQTQDFARSLLGIAVDQLSMTPVPQAVKPLTEAFFNYDTFQGRPIDSMGQERLPPADRYTARTSAPAIGIGKAINVSPQRIEHLVRGYFGWLGLQALNVADLVTRPLTDLPSNPNRDVYSVSNWPLAGDFVKSNAGMSSKYVDRFYANQQQTEQLYAAYSAARKAGDVERAHELAGTDAVRLRTLHNAMNRRMQEINQRIRRATSDRSLAAGEKRLLLEGLYQQRNSIAERADSRLRAASP